MGETGAADDRPSVAVRMKYVSRKEWGAAAPRSRVAMRGKPRGIFVHYTASSYDRVGDHALCDDRVRGIQRYHMQTRGWSDIGYSWLVCRHGVIFEGRGWGIVGAHTLSYNATHHAVCFLGADLPGRDDVTDLGRAAIGTVVREAAKFGDLVVRPHSAVYPTQCPGDELRAWIAARGWVLDDEPDHRSERWHGFWKWLHWVDAGRPAGKRPDVPRRIPREWWERRRRVIERRGS